MQRQPAASLREAVREDCEGLRGEIIDRIDAWRDKSPLYRQNELGRILNGIRGATAFEVMEIVLELGGERILEYVNAKKGLRIERKIHGADAIAAMRIEQMERDLAMLRRELGGHKKPAIRKGDVEEPRLTLRRG